VIILLAEIYNKISSEGTNLSDRLEDQLTGNFFGTIRYLPFEEGLGKILLKVRFNNPIIEGKWKLLINSIKEYELEFQFWPKDSEGEIDLILKAGNTYIGIEVKYLSGISSDDNENVMYTTDYNNSRYQLSRYSRMLTKFSKGTNAYLLFLAPFHMVNLVENELLKRTIINPQVNLGFLNWQDVTECLEHLSTNDKGREIIINDLKDLLNKKGFGQFSGFSKNIILKEINNEIYRFSLNKKIVSWKWNEIQIKGSEHYDFNT
jgi:hypothetical protein